MGLFTKIILGAAALKTYNTANNRPTVVPPEGFSVVNMKPLGIGKKWQVTWVDNKRPNMKCNFTISTLTRSISVGRDTFTVYWPK